MSVIFKPQHHQYESLDPLDTVKWMSVSKFIELFKVKFDPIAGSIKCSKNKKSKWYGIDPLKIQSIWAGEGERSVSGGTNYHDKQEADLLKFPTTKREGRDINIIKPIYKEGIKHAPVQKLEEGIYPEHFMYLKSAGICGQSDKVEVIRTTVDIDDHKTNKKIDKESFKNWEGKYEMMLGPCAHLMNCNYNWYTLQLSTYLYMILKHNPGLSAGKLTLLHTIFEKESEDQWGYPVYKKDLEGNNIVQEIVPYVVPYLKNEVRAMIQWYQENKK